MNRDEATPSAMQHQAGRLAAAQMGQFEESIAAYRKFLERRPDSAETHRDLGAALQACGRLDEAVAAYSKAIALKPDFAEAHYDLGNIAMIQNRLEDAIAAYSKAIALKPDSAAAHYSLGNVLRRVGRNNQAFSAYLTAIRLKPDFTLAHFNLGQACRTAGEPEKAMAAYRNALRIEPGHAEALANMAMVLAELQRFSEALDCHAQLAARLPDAAVTHEVLGKIMLEQQDAPAAAEHFRRALAINPNFDTAWYSLGTALRSQGKFDEAAKCYRRVLEICSHPGVGLVYGHLMYMGAVEPADIERIKALLREPNMSAEGRSAAGFALGKALEEAGRYDEAFDQYAEANSLAKQLRASIGDRYEPGAMHRLYDEVIEVFTPEYFEQRRGWGEPSELPVFIVGMPRSGTTLLQQIAASHPLVHGAGELNDIADMTRAMGGTNVKSAALGWDRDSVKAAAQRHLQRLQSLNGAASRVIDKMPSNVHRLGLIALLFPSARVIFCHRDARDTCLSCYFQRFARGNTFSFDLAHCGHEYLATERLMNHWKHALPLAMLEVQYEELVADLEGQSRRLIDFLGLPWDPACLEFHRTESTILTASSWQVRQPIYQSSVGRWRHYERHLGPLLEVLGG